MFQTGGKNKDDFQKNISAKWIVKFENENVEKSCNNKI